MTKPARLTLEDAERGPRLTPALIRRLRKQLSDESEARIVIIQGSAGRFCEGLDLQSVGGEVGSSEGTASVGATLESFRQLLQELRATPRPVIAVVDGPAMGGGVGLAAVADLVIASRRATFSLPETLFGLIPAVIFPYLSERAGVARARAMAITGEALAADRAERWGLVDQLTDDPAGEIARLERRLTRQDPAAQAQIKRLINQHFSTPDGYAASAMSAFSSLLDSESTRSRLARFAAGGHPWPDVPDARR